MARTSNGDRLAFSRVFELAFPSLLRSISCATGDEHLSEDIAQETLLKIWQARQTYRPGARVLPWARTIARRTLIDALRRGRLEKKAIQDVGVSGNAGGDPRCEDVLDARRNLASALSAIRRLPKSQAEALTMMLNDGTGPGEIARRSGETSLALRLRVHRARTTLRQFVADI